MAQLTVTRAVRRPGHAAAPAPALLLRQVAAGDEEAWRTLVARYARVVQAVPLRYGLAAEDAADVCQMVFATLLRQLEQIEQPERLASWLMSVARRKTWEVLRRRDRRRDAERRAGVEQERGASLDARLDWEEQGLLLDVVTGLDDRCRELVLALFFDAEEPDYREVATRLGVAVNSVGPMRSRCLHRLRGALREAEW